MRIQIVYDREDSEGKIITTETVDTSRINTVHSNWECLPSIGEADSEVKEEKREKTPEEIVDDLLFDNFIPLVEGRWISTKNISEIKLLDEPKV